MNRFGTMMFGAVCFAFFQLFLCGCGSNSSVNVKKSKTVGKRIELAQKKVHSTPESVVSNPDPEIKIENKPRADAGTGRDPVYRAKGRIDPFAPLVRVDDPPSKKKTGEKPAKGKKEILESVDLSQLKLVGVVLANSGNRALVVMANGKGHIIEKGTGIGLNSGRVLEISGEGAIIEEEPVDWKGIPFTRKVEMKLQKPFGEGYSERQS